MSDSNLLKQLVSEPIPVSEWLEIRGNTQVKLARELNVNQTTVRQWGLRDCYIRETANGYEVFEVRRLPGKSKTRGRF